MGTLDFRIVKRAGAFDSPFFHEFFVGGQQMIEMWRWSVTAGFDVDRVPHPEEIRVVAERVVLHADEVPLHKVVLTTFPKIGGNFVFILVLLFDEDLVALLYECFEQRAAVGWCIGRFEAEH